MTETHAKRAKRTFRFVARTHAPEGMLIIRSKRFPALNQKYNVAPCMEWTWDSHAYPQWPSRAHMLGDLSAILGRTVLGLYTVDDKGRRQIEENLPTHGKIYYTIPVIGTVHGLLHARKDATILGKSADGNTHTIDAVINI